MSPKFQGVIFDIDGVLEFHGIPYPGALEALKRLRQRGIVIRILSNSTLKSRSTAAAKLRAQGFGVEDEQVITASYATAVYLRSLQPRSCWVLLDGSGRDEFQDFLHTTEDPEYVVVGDYRHRFNFENMNKALRVLKNGAKLIGMIPELIDYTQGELELNVGSWVQLLERASGVPAVYIGKPFPFTFELALQGMGLHRAQVVMVGDQISTDIKGARGVGLPSILVRAGEYAPSPGDQDIQADFQVDSVQEILGIIEGD